MKVTIETFDFIVEKHNEMLLQLYPDQFTFIHTFSCVEFFFLN